MVPLALLDEMVHLQVVPDFHYQMKCCVMVSLRLAEYCMQGMLDYCLFRPLNLQILLCKNT